MLTSPRDLEGKTMRLAPIVLAVLCVAIAGCGGGGSSESATGAATQAVARDAGLHVVALGDSETNGTGDPSGLGWVGRYVRLLHAKTARQVDVTNLAREGMTSADLRTALKNDQPMQNAVENADIVLLGVGGADLNAGDDNFAAGQCRAEQCYAPVLKSFAGNLDAILASVRELRRSHETAIRSITQPNVLTGAEDVIPSFLKPIATRVGVYQATTANRAICRATAKYGGRCIDVLRAINGPTGTGNGYKSGLLNHAQCCYPNARGQQLIAALLVKTGLAPIGR
jgi:GDSL-like Lipase/Acylhydrolase family